MSKGQTVFWTDPRAQKQTYSVYPEVMQSTLSGYRPLELVVRIQGDQQRTFDFTEQGAEKLIEALQTALAEGRRQFQIETLVREYRRALEGK